MPELIREKPAELQYRCPRLYDMVTQNDGSCLCDCISGNVTCEWIKKGNEHFSMEDRM